eukprot:jgi/Botrbrau1/5214/Bobra.0172s0078.1
MERIKRYFAEQGLRAADIPTAIVVHEVVGLGMAVGFWAMCYAIEPSKTVMRPFIARKAKNKTLEQGYAAAMSKAQAMISRFPWLQRAAGNPVRLTTSLAESLCLRAAIKPFTFTFKLWVSYKLVLAFKRRRKEGPPAAAWMCVGLPLRPFSADYGNVHMLDYDNAHMLGPKALAVGGHSKRGEQGH